MDARTSPEGLSHRLRTLAAAAAVLAVALATLAASPARASAGLLAPPHADFGLDPDADTLWDYLVVSVHVDVTTAGGVEEDIIKCYKPFVLGTFDVRGKNLREKGVNRVGNVFVPNSRYIWFEKFMNAFLPKMLEKQNALGRPLASDARAAHRATPGYTAP